MALTKVTSGLISADASLVDLNIDAGTLYIDATNNRVGVGQTSPTDKLHVGTSSGGTQLKIQSGSGVNNCVLYTNGTTDSWRVGMNLALTNGSYEFYDDVNNVDRMVITSSGNVGIGTSTAPAANGGGLAIYRSDYPRITLRNTTTGDTTGDGFQAALVGNDMQWDLTEGGSQKFYTSGTERVRIVDDGEVRLYNALGIQGSYTGNGQGVGVYGSSVCAIVSSRNSVGAAGYFAKVNTGSSDLIEFNVATTYVGKIHTNGSTTSYSSASDYRLKENVVELPNALERVNALNPVQFDWISDSSTTEGFLAHEAQSIVPYAVQGQHDEIWTEEECIDENSDKIGQPKYQSMDYGKLTPLLVKAIQEQQTIIEDLKTRITTLENA